MGDKAPVAWVVSELFHPEETSTGQVMTALARDLDAVADVRVVCSQPTYSRKGTLAPRRELLDGTIDVRRLRSTTFGKSSMFGRLADMMTLTLSALASLAVRLRADDAVFVVTNPPLMPYAVAICAALRRAKVVLIVHDMFPEVLRVGGPPSGPARLVLRIADRISEVLYRSAAAIVVIGPDQRDRIVQKCGDDVGAKIHCIPLPFDAGFDVPLARAESRFLREDLAGVEGDTVFQFAGNIGPLQGIDFLAEAISEQRVDAAHFCFVGHGRSRHRLEEIADRSNVSLHDWVPREQARDLHAGCDVIIVSLVPGMWGISVPSRISNALAAGRPILAVVDEGSSLDRVIREFGVGWSVRPGDVDGFWAAVEEACDDSRRLSMAERARAVGLDRYDPQSSAESYHRLLDEVAGRTRSEIA